MRIHDENKPEPAAPEATAKCPGCGSPKLTYLSTELKVICEGCFSSFYVWKLQDFAQFFYSGPLEAK